MKGVTIITMLGIVFGQQVLNGTKTPKDYPELPQGRECFAWYNATDRITIPTPMKEHSGAAIQYVIDRLKDDPDSLPDYNRVAVEQHNQYRTLLGLQKLAYSESLARSAKRYADHLVTYKLFDHSGTDFRPSTVGENLWRRRDSPRRGRFAEAMAGWMGEYKFYHGEPVQSGPFHEYGHYTAIIWPQTRYVGCAFSMQGTYQVIVCHYDPEGNDRGVVLHVKVSGTYATK
jgi:hypothetical protein